MPTEFDLAYPIDHLRSEPPHVPSCASGEARHFRVEGERWLACEEHAPDGSSLFFLGPGVMRRVRQFPSNWRELSDEELYSLSWCC